MRILDTNPNDLTGGGGCLLSETKHTDCEGPYIHFVATDMDSAISPHAVACKQCIVDAYNMLTDEDQEIAAGPDPGTIPDLVASYHQPPARKPKPGPVVVSGDGRDEDDEIARITEIVDAEVVEDEIEL